MTTLLEADVEQAALEWLSGSRLAGPARSGHRAGYAESRARGLRAGGA